MQTSETVKASLGPTKGVASYGLYAVMGVVVGFFSGMFGVGGGIIMVPFLLLVAGYTQQQSQGISLAAMVVTALTGAIGYYRGGTLTVPMLLVALTLAIGSIPGATMGAKIAQQLDKNTLSALFAMFIIAMAVRIMPSNGAKALGLSFASGVTGSMLILVGMLVLAVGVRLALSR
jgi:uncharacterized membrane protein YfcA